MPTTTGLTIPFTGLRKQYNALREEILNATDEVLRSGVLMNGNNTAEFENWLAKKNRTTSSLTENENLITRNHSQSASNSQPKI